MPTGQANEPAAEPSPVNGVDRDTAMAELREVTSPTPNVENEVFDDVEAAPRKKNIWDLEGEAGDDDAAPRREPVGRVRVQTKSSDAEALEADRPASRLRAAVRQNTPDTNEDNSGGRVKTRILGFHSDDFALDALSAAAEPKSETSTFPVGWIVVTEGPGRGAAFTLAAGVSTIGRAADQTVCLDFGDASVSRENHASIAFDEEQSKFFIGHGGKRNIVRRNDNPVLATEDLEHGDVIKIGKTELKFVAFCGPEFSWTANEDEGSDDD